MSSFCLAQHTIYALSYIHITFIATIVSNEMSLLSAQQQNTIFINYILQLFGDDVISLLAMNVSFNRIVVLPSRHPLAVAYSAK